MCPRSIGALIERQVRRWEILQPPGAAAVLRPCVAISRLPHASAGQVGRLVAERLEYGYFGRELLEVIARERGIRQALVEGLDEQVLDRIDRVVADLFHLRNFTESDYLREIARAITTLGRRGSVVIVGRGAAHVLSPERALRVLLVASAEVRAERLARAEQLDPDVAAKKLAQLDAQRGEFVRHQFGLRQDDPTCYDLTLNTGTLSLETSAELVVEALRQRFPVTD